MMHVVDSRFLIADDGRIVFRTGRQYVYIPEPDLHLVRRRNFQANVVGAAALLLSNIGYPKAYWQPWWIFVGAAIWVAAYYQVGRWARERYGDATNPSTDKDVRRALQRIGRAPNPSYEIAMASIALAVMGFNVVVGAPRPATTGLVLGLLGNLLGAFRGFRRLQAERADEAV